MEAVAPVFETVKCLSVPVVRRISHVKNLKKNFGKLKKLAKELYDRRDDLNMKVNTARPTKVPTCELQTWFKEVDEIENQINAIIADYKQEKKCIIGWCPVSTSRLKLGKQMVDLINEVSALKERIKSNSDVILDALPSAVEKVFAPVIEVGNSAERTLQKIMDCIKSASVRKIGVWGMGGVGKTTVMQNLNNLPEITQMFDIVIWVTVSREWNLRKVQYEVARRLPLALSNDMSDYEVSRRLYQELENTNYLLLLDDLWDKVSLEEVGIPTPNACKIVLTTRYLNVCNKMETDKEIKVETLSEEEAWKLFSNKVGSAVALPRIEPIARSVVKECGGLPLAVIVVGGALRKEDNVHVWRNALQELSTASPSQMEDMDEKVFKRLKFSYDRLRRNIQKCFLYGALYPEDHQIKVAQLIEYWRAAGFIEGVGSLAEALDRGYAIIKSLVDASLFEYCGGVYAGEERVKMHDVIRDLALRITSVEGAGIKFLVRARMGMLGDSEEWKECDAVSLMQIYNLHRLPEQVWCPTLTTLLLQRNFELQVIPGSFFDSMASLQILDLSRTRIKLLPPSICSLINLHGLYLNDCQDLVGLPPEIGALKKLEVLHLEGSGIHDLPIELEGLTCLKSLHVSFVQDKGEDEDKLSSPNIEMMIPQGMISRLSLLEDLRINLKIECHFQWDMTIKDVVKDICKLKRLATLEIVFTRVEYLESFVETSEPWRNKTLSSFHLSVGNSYTSDYPTYTRFQLYCLYGVPGPVDRYFELVDGMDIPSVVRQVLHRANGFGLYEHKSIKNLGEFGAENMTHLEELSCYRCNEMESLIDSTCSLPAIQKIHLHDMPKLKNIWGDEQQGCQLPVNLRELHLGWCGSLPKVLFSGSIIRQLPNLEELYISSCEGIHYMISVDDDVEHNALPKLKVLSLRNLPDFTIISKHVLAWPSIENVSIDTCFSLKSLPFGIHNTSTLRSIRCNSRAWWESLQWEDDEIKNQLSQLRSFVTSEC